MKPQFIKNQSFESHEKKTEIKTKHKPITLLAVMVMLLCSHCLSAMAQPEVKHNVAFKDKTLEEALMLQQRTSTYKFTYNIEYRHPRQSIPLRIAE